MNDEELEEVLVRVREAMDEQDVPLPRYVWCQGVTYLIKENGEIEVCNDELSVKDTPTYRNAKNRVGRFPK